MPFATIQPAFAAGEISPSLFGRVDLAKTHIAATTMRNLWYAIAMKRIAKPLPPQAELHRLLDYDPATGIFIWKCREEGPKNWNVRRSGMVAGSLNGDGYVVINVNGSLYKAHRLAWVYVRGDVLPQDQDIDHRDTIRNHNWIDNLRPATASQNLSNSIPQKRSLPRGVHRDRHRYRAVIRVATILHHLGTFATANEAHQAYVAAARRLHGEFARPV